MNRIKALMYDSAPAAREAWQALGLWTAFFAAAIILNGAIPFALGADLHGWTASLVKDILFHLVIYAGLFLAAPLIAVKGWRTVSQPAFLLPLLLAGLAITLRPVVARWTASLAVAVLAYLHWRFDLSGLGFRSQGWIGDLAAAVILMILPIVPVLLRPGAPTAAPGAAVLAGLDRLFANPASTVENLFYFGFLAERLAPKTGRWLTPPLVGLLYTAHELTNPEYWYEGMSFGLVFVGVTLVAAVYLWRRSLIVIWLGDGLGRLASRLF